MDKRTRTWVTIIVGVVACAGLLMIAAVAGTVYWVSSHVQSEAMPERSANDRFTEARQRFGGEDPIVELRDDHEPVMRRVAHASTQGAAPRLQALRVLVYDKHEERLTEVSVPFWVVRLLPSGHFTIHDDDIELDSDRLGLTSDDLERFGPALVLDHEDRRGTRVLVWTE